MRTLVLSILATLLLAAPAAAACEGANVVPTRSTLERASKATICLMNQERVKRGLPRLQDSSALQRVATAHSRDMVRRDYFSHVSPGGSTLSDRLAKIASTGGENIAWGYGNLGSPRATVKMWMNSPGHRANVLRRAFRKAGVGVAAGVPQRGISGGATYTANFSS